LSARTRTRQTAEERRETVLAAAIAAFASTGYHGTATETIARNAGISHAYLFRLFGTKKELFLACLDRGFGRTLDAFRAAVQAPGEEHDTLMGAMGAAYIQMLADRELLLFQMQAYAAADDPDIRARTREWYERLYEEIGRLSGEPRDDILRFMGQGMLLNVVASLELPAEDWVFLTPDT